MINLTTVTRKIIPFLPEEIRHHYEQQNGFCLNCDRFTVWGTVSPKAEGRMCPQCQNRSVFGVLAAFDTEKAIGEMIDKERQAYDPK
jgi:hypothetical protein